MKAYVKARFDPCANSRNTLASCWPLWLLFGAISAAAKSKQPFVPQELVIPADTEPKMTIIEEGESDYVIVRGAELLQHALRYEPIPFE